MARLPFTCPGAITPPITRPRRPRLYATDSSYGKGQLRLVDGTSCKKGVGLVSSNRKQWRGHLLSVFLKITFEAFMRYYFFDELNRQLTRVHSRRIDPLPF